MQKHKLGKQGPDISVVGFGAWEAGGDSYGPNSSESEVIEAIHRLANPLAHLTADELADLKGTA